jgi:hypothetical protein
VRIKRTISVCGGLNSLSGYNYSNEFFCKMKRY